MATNCSISKPYENKENPFKKNLISNVEDMAKRFSNENGQPRSLNDLFAQQNGVKVTNTFDAESISIGNTLAEIVIVQPDNHNPPDLLETYDIGNCTYELRVVILMREDNVTWYGTVYGEDNKACWVQTESQKFL